MLSPVSDYGFSKCRKWAFVSLRTVRLQSDLVAVIEDVLIQVDLKAELAGAEREALGDERAGLLGLPVDGRVLDLRTARRQTGGGGVTTGRTVKRGDTPRDD